VPLLLLGQPLQKALVSVVSDRIGIKFGRIVPELNMQQLMESDFRYRIILSRWRPWRPFMQQCAVLPPSEWKWNVCHTWV